MYPFTLTVPSGVDSGDDGDLDIRRLVSDLGI
jgi:hypothetical protein